MLTSSTRAISSAERKLTGREGEKVEGHVCKWDDGQHAVVTVGLNEIVTGDGCRVDVVLSEWTYKSLQGGKKEDKLENMSYFNNIATPDLINIPFQRWVDPPTPMYRPPSEQALTQSQPWVFLPLKKRKMINNTAESTTPTLLFLIRILTNA